MLQTSPHAYHFKRIFSFGEGWNAVPSNNFTSREGGQVILEGAGQGHGIGLCPEAGGRFWTTISPIRRLFCLENKMLAGVERPTFDVRFFDWGGTPRLFRTE